jgi:histidinol-phosphate aminotransferase
MPLVNPKPHVMKIVPYIAGEASIPGFSSPAKLSSNESPLGPSPAAVAAYMDAAGQLARYPDGAAVALRQALARRHRLEPDQVVCGTGSEQLIDCVCRAYVSPGDEVIITEFAFVCYLISTLAAGGVPVKVPERNLTADVDTILEHVTPRTKVVFLANPNNPTGTWIPRSELHRLRAHLPQHVLLVIDAAYSEYCDLEEYSFGEELVERQDGNTLVLHTFSKIFGLAALRVGWARAPREVAMALHRVRGVFNVSLPAQVAAIAALEDTAHTRKARAHNDYWLPWLDRELRSLGLEVIPSIGNFLLLAFADEKQSKSADAFLRARGLILRPVANYGLGHCLRLSVGLEEENRAVVAALGQWRDGAA